MTTTANDFTAFAAANPDILTSLIERARAIIAMGHRYVSVRVCWEIERYGRRPPTDGSDSPWALNNNFVPYYSRLIIEQAPDLAPYIRTRQAKADREARS